MIGLKYPRIALRYNIGDMVGHKAENIKSLKDSKKMNDRFLGSFTVIEKVSSHDYRLDLPQTQDVFHVQLLERQITNTIPNRLVPPPPLGSAMPTRIHHQHDLKL
jgi:hypothetical protein